MANEKFSIKEAIKYGWETFKANIPFFLVFMVVMALLTILPSYLADKLFESESVSLGIVKILIRISGLLLAMISTRISLDIHDSGQANLSRIAETLPLFPAYLIGKIVYSLIILLLPLIFMFIAVIAKLDALNIVALLLIIFPGIPLAYMFLYLGYLIIDRSLGTLEGWNPIHWVVTIARSTSESLSESRLLTDGYKMDLFIFSFCMALINSPGVFFILLGGITQIKFFVFLGIVLMLALLATIPLTLMASVYVYRRLSPAEEVAAAEPA